MENQEANGDVIILGDVFEKIITWVHNFKVVGDMVVPFNPGHAALPWAGVSSIAQSINYSYIEPSDGRIVQTRR
jgi:predicted nicotinamide N-methyase